ncbi:hypothetical protein V495_00950 [Pseudogymnoascus sp. VKM F-4514 (FW-929)]|nr:hypothetical protein V495_00950 [Pseudogymnoascus sp. VKM F-4514 (FW-929)]KFY64922.1 hypothetical protein V497_01566 [Pseudogymnoascus sp. VKM F-4516 (FW-969)]
MLSAGCWASLFFGFAAAGVAPLNSDIQVRNAPGTSSSETLWALRRALASAAVESNNTVFRNSTSFDTSWDGAVLFHYESEAEKGNLSVAASLEIVCTRCYIKGKATAELTIDGDFDFSGTVKNVTSEIGGEVANVTDTVIDYAGDYVGNITRNLVTGNLSIDDFDFPPFDVGFHVDLPKLPESHLKFQFDGLELYMEIDTILSGSATYSLNLFTSKSEIGVKVNDLLVGVVFTIDLIVSVDAEIDISSGFHIQLNDGIAIDMHMFDQDISTLTFNGGNFEFLPVKLVGANTVLTAVLRLGVEAGLQLSTGTRFIGPIPADVSSGIVAGFWADVAQFVTNVTAAPDSDDCPLQVVEEYSMLLGAKAGATIAVEHHSWGPAPSTQVPIWFTTLADACAGTKTVAEPVVTSAAVVEREEGMVTTTTVVTRTATVCLSTGLLNCPASLQSAVQNVVTSTLVAASPVGDEDAFPTTAADVVVNTVAFGKNAREMDATTGSPVSYVPKTSTTTTSEPTSSGSGSRTADDDSITEGKTGGVSNKVIIGVSVGVGVPVLILIIAGCIYCYKRRRYAPVQMTESPYVGGKSNFGTPQSDNSGFAVTGRS